MSVAPESGRNRIMFYGPKNDGTYVVEFTTADGEALAISVPRNETAVPKRFQNVCLTGCSCRTFFEESLGGLGVARCGALITKKIIRRKHSRRVPETPSFEPRKRSDGVLVCPAVRSM